MTNRVRDSGTDLVEFFQTAEQLTKTLQNLLILGIALQYKVFLSKAGAIGGRSFGLLATIAGTITSIVGLALIPATFGASGAIVLAGGITAGGGGLAQVATDIGYKWFHSPKFRKQANKLIEDRNVGHRTFNDTTRLNVLFKKCEPVKKKSKCAGKVGDSLVTASVAASGFGGLIKNGFGLFTFLAKPIAQIATKGGTVAKGANALQFSSTAARVVVIPAAETVLTVAGAAFIPLDTYRLVTLAKNKSKLQLGLECLISNIIDDLEEIEKAALLVARGHGFDLEQFHLNI